MNFETMHTIENQEPQENRKETLGRYVNALEAEAIREIDRWEDEKHKADGRRKVAVWKTLTELAIMES